mmetsp:Transcript_13633/g.26850  ORF Transcript_13633/g.26850 Transcript_13633/m.26850 type:complete len:158 (+) Transcript_13633:265-738(+)
MGGIVSTSLGRRKQAKQFNVDPVLSSRCGIKGCNKIASIPGVGVVGFNSTTKISHASSFSSRNEQGSSKIALRGSVHRPSQLAPSLRHVSSVMSRGLEVTSFQLSANKPPVCVVLSEEVEFQYPMRSRIPFLPSSSLRGLPWEERGGQDHRFAVTPP